VVVLKVYVVVLQVTATVLAVRKVKTLEPSSRNQSRELTKLSANAAARRELAPVLLATAPVPTVQRVAQRLQLRLRRLHRQAGNSCQLGAFSRLSFLLRYQTFHSGTRLVLLQGQSQFPKKNCWGTRKYSTVDEATIMIFRLFSKVC